MRRALVVVGLVLSCASVVAVRSVGFEQTVDPEDGSVLLTVDDAQYHARRAVFTAESFPRVLWFDPYLNHPHGSWVPWPPLYDFALGAAGWLTGDLGSVLAWASVGIAALTALVVFSLARRLGGAGAGLGAVGVFALLPASTRYSAVGNPDHHALVALLGAGLLATHARALAGRAPGHDLPPPWGTQALLVGLRLAMLLSWHGSILYVVLGEMVALGVASALGDRGVLRAQAVGCALTAGLGFACLGLPHSELGGAWSPLELSLLQPGVYLGVGIVAGGSALWVARARSPWTRLAGTAGLGVGVATVLGIAAREGLLLAWAYVSRAEAYIAHNYEAHPLWQGGIAGAADLYGHLVLLLPLAPLAGLWAAARARDAGPGLTLAAWTSVLLALAVSNARYGSDLGPALSVSFALLAGQVVAALGRRGRAWGVAAALVAWVALPLLFVQSLSALAPHAARSWAALRGARIVVKRPAEGFDRSVRSFVDAVRRATPETAGFDDPDERPAYGIVSPPTLGCVVVARGHRATPAGNFGPYVGREGMAATSRFYGARTEREALAALRGLKIHYAITSDEGVAPGRLWHRLHHGDGAATPGLPALGLFRLVTESPRPGVPLGALRGAAPDFVDVPYKLFEIVLGAVLEVPGDPGESAAAEVEVETPSGRRFVWRSEGPVGREGVARLRVPYATAPITEPPVAPGSGPVARALGPYLVRRGDARWTVRVPEAQVRGGQTVRLTAPDEASSESPQPLAPPRNSGTLPAP